MSKLESLFICFRTSWFFVLTVIGFISVWIVWHLIPGLPQFDDPVHFGHLNLILSVEATIATVMIMRDSERSRLREVAILDELSASLAKLCQIERDIDEIQDCVDPEGD